MTKRSRALAPIGELSPALALVTPDAERLRLQDRLDPKVFAHWMGLIGDRLGRRLESPTLRQYYREMAPALVTEQFVLGARALFNRNLFAQWPGPGEFVLAAQQAAAASAGVGHVPGVDQTLAALEAERAVPPIDPDRMRQTIEDARRLAATLKHEGSVIHVPRAD